ncbi:hypothetical protein ACHAWF_016055, partial [Thalassiosira exigua]
PDPPARRLHATSCNSQAQAPSCFAAAVPCVSVAACPRLALLCAAAVAAVTHWLFLKPSRRGRCWTLMAARQSLIRSLCWLLLLNSSPKTSAFTSTRTARITMSASKGTSDKRALTQNDYKANLQSTRITSKDVATLPKPGTTAPTSIQFLSDTKLSFLLAPDATSLSRQLFVVDIPSGERTQIHIGGKATEEGKFSHEEQMRRERLRLHATGVTSYELSKGSDDGSGKKGRVGLIPHGGGLWIWDDCANDSPPEPRLLVDSSDVGGATILDAKISVDGSTVAFVADNEVYVMPVAGDKPTQVTCGARGIDGRTNGVADYLAQEELSRPEGFWLSPNGQALAFEQVDESHIPAYRIVNQASPGGLAPALKEGGSPEDMVETTKVPYEEHRFAFAGAVNPIVKLGIQKTDLQDVLWLDLEFLFGNDFYLAKLEWLDDNSGIIVQVLDRRQKNLALVMFDATSGGRTNLHMERAIDRKSWVNLNDCFKVLEHVPGEKLTFLWGSEQDGFRHLYVEEANLTSPSEFDSKECNRVTGPGDFIVDTVVDLDKDTNSVYYMGTAPGGKWLGSRLYRASLDGKQAAECHCLSPEKGVHACKVSSKLGLFVDAHSTVDHPVQISVRKLGGDKILDVYDASAADPRVGKLNLKPPTFHTFSSSDKKVILQSAVYLPDPEVHGKGPYPLVVATYGGPHVQYVQNSWGIMTADLRTQFLRDQGFAIIKTDNRGSNRRGLVFETPIYGNLGELEVADQVAGVQFAIDQGWADPDKVAVSGWSYGGYMAIKCLSERPDVFHAAVSGAPVTDWTLYDSAYTERYMGLPQENLEGYQKSSALHKVKDIAGSLMLCHGLMDENVLFRQSAVLINELIEHQKMYDLVLFPSERHGPRRPKDRAFLEERILSFLQRSLSV